MSDLATALWERAGDSLKAARHVLSVSCDAAASRAYYAAFYAVSALFALEGKEFRKHSALEAAVHRDLVKAGRWTRKLGAGYSFLAEMRTTGDYGDPERVAPQEAAEAVELAERILHAVSQHNPEAFPRSDKAR